MSTETERQELSDTSVPQELLGSTIYVHELSQDRSPSRDGAEMEGRLEGGCVEDGGVVQG
jgi:hypothetical protein